LSKELYSDNPVVALTSYEQLVSMGPDGIEEVLESWGPDGHFGTRIIREIGPSILDELTARLTLSISEDDKVVTIEAIGALGPDGRGALEYLVDELRSESQAIRVASCEAIEAIHPDMESVGSSLYPLLEDNDIRVVSAACFTIGSLTEGANANAIQKLLGVIHADPSGISKQAAAYALYKNGYRTDDMFELIESCALAYPSCPAYGPALYALARIDSDASRDVMRRIVLDESKPQILAMMALTSYAKSDESARILVDALEFEETQGSALYYLSVFGESGNAALPELYAIRNGSSQIELFDPERNTVLLEMAILFIERES